jgi:hypothetical protein
MVVNVPKTVVGTKQGITGKRKSPTKRAAVARVVALIRAVL